MKIEIKLKDPESCEGCEFGYWDSLLVPHKGYVSKWFCLLARGYIKVDGNPKTKRPARCKEENGL